MLRSGVLSGAVLLDNFGHCRSAVGMRPTETMASPYADAVDAAGNLAKRPHESIAVLGFAQERGGPGCSHFGAVSVKIVHPQNPSGFNA